MDVMASSSSFSNDGRMGKKKKKKKKNTNTQGNPKYDV
jgi:hypothetical protein